ncbi:hypothetical protein BLA29_011295 [Euroglyphus maynei]|uniref:Uncharacterized protein n=1 Tax=Euroglyphus maynei TaxID=6958 RepID=A0A1Y3BSZ1_EURMA|nr:hypothetical protein BLA29_011295 [Euroglyphus maynei]
MKSNDNIQIDVDNVGNVISHDPNETCMKLKRSIQTLQASMKTAVREGEQLMTTVSQSTPVSIKSGFSRAHKAIISGAESLAHEAEHVVKRVQNRVASAGQHVFQHKKTPQAAAPPQTAKQQQQQQSN